MLLPRQEKEEKNGIELRASSDSKKNEQLEIFEMHVKIGNDRVLNLASLLSLSFSYHFDHPERELERRLGQGSGLMQRREAYDTRLYGLNTASN